MKTGTLLTWIAAGDANAFRQFYDHYIAYVTKVVTLYREDESLAVEDLVRMSIHGATPDNIRALQAAGYRGMVVEDVIKFRIHKVTPEFITALNDRGYKNIMAEDLVKMRIHKVTPEEMDHACSKKTAYKAPGAYAPHFSSPPSA